MKISKIFSALIVVFLCRLANSACYISPLPDLDCMAAGRENIDLKWSPNLAQRVILFGTDDVQKSSLGCMRMAYIVQTECKIKDPVIATFFPIEGVTEPREVTMVLEPKPSLIDAPNLSQAFKDYFAGVLKDPAANGGGVSVIDTAPKVIDAHSREQVLSFLTKPPGQAMRFLSSCEPRGAIVSDGTFMAACTRNSKGEGRLELMRIKSGCATCIDKVEALLGRFSYASRSLTQSDPTLNATVAKASYTSTEMPLLSQFSGYLPFALDTADSEIAGYCSPVSASMAMIALKARSSPYTLLGNVLDLPGCSHTYKGKFYGDCSLKTARVAEQMNWKQAMTSGAVIGTDGALLTRVNTYKNLSTIVNLGAFVSAPITSKVDIQLRYSTTMYSAYTRCSNNTICEDLPWFRVPAQNTTVTDLSTLPATALAPITSTGYDYMASEFNTALTTSFSNSFARTMVVRKSVASPFPLDMRKTWVLHIAPLFFYQNTTHAVTVSGIESSYITVNDPHGLKYNLTNKSCNVLVQDRRTFDGGSITADRLVSKTKLSNNVYRFIKSRHGITHVNLDNPNGGGVQQIGTCLSHLAGSGASDIFKNSPFWVLTGHWSALPWGAGPQWNQASTFRNTNSNPMTSLIAEQTGVTRLTAFRDPHTIAKCRSNMVNLITKVGGVNLKIRSLVALSIKKEGLTQVPCDKFEVTNAAAPNTSVPQRYGSATLACVNEQVAVRKMECSSSTVVNLLVANGRAHRTYDTVSKSFSPNYIVDSCLGNWQVSTEKNSCVCEGDNSSNGPNRVIWDGNKSACQVICKTGFSPGLYTDGKYRCTLDKTFNYTALEDGTCRFKDKQGGTVSGAFKNDFCYGPTEGANCQYSSSVTGLWRNGLCLAPNGTACTANRNGRDFAGTVTNGVCFIANNTACTYAEGTTNLAGYFSGNRCIPNENTVCAFVRNSASIAGRYRGGTCVANDGINCNFTYANTPYSATYVSGMCRPADGLACTYYDNGKAVPGGKFINTSCRPPDGYTCSVGQTGSKINGTYLNGVCSVPNGSTCTFVTDLGQTVSGRVAGLECVPPQDTECVLLSTVTNQRYLGKLQNGVFCNVADGTDCSYIKTNSTNTTSAKFYQNSCLSITEGGTCGFTAGQGTVKGFYVGGVCTAPEGEKCRFNSGGLSGQFYDGVCAKADGQPCTTTIPGSGLNTYQGVFARGICVPHSGQTCRISNEFGANLPGIISAGVCRINDGLTCPTYNRAAVFRNNVCQVPDGTSCDISDAGLGSIQGLYKNGSCGYKDSQACTLQLMGQSYSGTGVNGLCKPADGASCFTVLYGNVATQFLNGKCLPKNGQICRPHSYWWGSYVNGVCMAPEESPCFVDPTDQVAAGTVRLGICQRTTALNFFDTIQLVSNLKDGDACTANLTSMPQGKIKAGVCIPNDGTNCFVMNFDQRIPGTYYRGDCKAQEGYPCRVDNLGSHRRGTYSSGVCLGLEGNFCLAANETSQNVIEGVYNMGVCTYDKTTPGCLAQQHLETPVRSKLSLLQGHNRC